MDTPIVLTFSIKLVSNSTIIRSIVLKEYFSKLTSNVEVLYPTQIHCGLLLCKSKRTEEKILNMRHVLSNGSTIHLSRLTCSLFQQIKCTISGQIMQLNDISTLFQQCLPFLHASDGKVQVNPDKSIVLEGHIFVLNSIHSFLINKISKTEQTNNTNASESLNLHSNNININVMSGKLLEQNVDSIIIPMSDKYKIHKAFERQIQSLDGTNIFNYFKELKIKTTHAHEGDVILLPNHGLKIPAKVLIFFIAPRISKDEAIKDKSVIDAFQPIYEKLIYDALQTIEQNNITSIAMPLLEPHVKIGSERRYANEMTFRAMISAIRQYSQNSSITLKRIIIVDHQIQIKRMSKRVEKYQKQLQKPISHNNNNNIDLNTGDRHSFAYIFGVPKISEVTSSASDTDDDIEPEDYQLPYKHHSII